MECRVQQTTVFAIIYLQLYHEAAVKPLEKDLGKKGRLSIKDTSKGHLVLN